MRAGWALAAMLASAAQAAMPSAAQAAMPTSAAQAGEGDPPAASVVSAPASAVAVTIYRAPGRSPDAPLPKGWLGGYALVSEERVVDLPAGDATVKFEGVAAGMLAESAILSGLPAGIGEKNLDAQLLSPRNLYARAFGRPVVLRRRHPGSGQVEQEPAIIRSGPDGAAVVQTRAGFEMVDCGGLRDSIAWQGLPPGLNAAPTLSVATHADRAQRVRLHLSYLAWGFDWQAHYVLTLAPGGRQGRLTAWLTLASGDDMSFPAAQASVMAGQPHFDETRGRDTRDGGLVLTCQAPPPPALAMAPPEPAAQGLEIIVTGARRMMKADYTARAENLGDLHLYRIPQATTVAAHGQKQVSLLAQRPVRLALVHVATVGPTMDTGATVVARLRNRREDGLGQALPAGQVSVVQRQGAAALPVGEAAMDDRAEGETIDLVLARSPGVHVVSVTSPAGKGFEHVRVTVTNANRWPVHFEGQLAVEEGAQVAATSTRLTRKNGKPLWSTVVPAQGRAVLSYTERNAEP